MVGACVEQRSPAKVVIGLNACRCRMSQAFGYRKMNSLADQHVVSMSCKMWLRFFKGGVRSWISSRSPLPSQPSSALCRFRLLPLTLRLTDIIIITTFAAAQSSPEMPPSRMDLS